MEWTDKQEQMAQELIDAEITCDVCRIYDCPMAGSAGVHGGPNGPIFPYCAEHEPKDFMDPDLLEEEYNKWKEELENDR